jgi:hypothetical protein
MKTEKPDVTSMKIREKTIEIGKRMPANERNSTGLQPNIVNSVTRDIAAAPRALGTWLDIIRAQPVLSTKSVKSDIDELVYTATEEAALSCCTGHPAEVGR